MPQREKQLDGAQPDAEERAERPYNCHHKSNSDRSIEETGEVDLGRSTWIWGAVPRSEALAAFCFTGTRCLGELNAVCTENWLWELGKREFLMGKGSTPADPNLRLGTGLLLPEKGSDRRLQLF